jgi:hypothetical protein
VHQTIISAPGVPLAVKAEARVALAAPVRRTLFSSVRQLPALDQLPPTVAMEQRHRGTVQVAVVVAVVVSSFYPVKRQKLTDSRFRLLEVRAAGAERSLDAELAGLAEQVSLPSLAGGRVTRCCCRV